MQTSDPDIYAVGECAEHDGHIYGLVAPGLEQAAVAAAHLAANAANYRGSVPTTKLKIVGTDVFSMGDVEQIDQRTDVRSFGLAANPARAATGGWLCGAAASSAHSRSANGRKSIAFSRRCATERSLWPWQAWRFRRTGRLYPVKQAEIGSRIGRRAATVCNCTGVTRGQLGEAMRLGATAVELLMRETNASTVCGTCRPLLQEILGGAGGARAGVRRPHHRCCLAAGRCAGACGRGAAAALGLIRRACEAGIGLDRLLDRRHSGSRSPASRWSGCRRWWRSCRSANAIG